MDELKVILGILPFLIPLFILELALLVVAILDVARREHVRGNSKVLWILVIVLVNIIGPIVYLLFGRKENGNDGD
jgi:hypothetical protein